MQRVLIAGCGFVGRAVARLLRAGGQEAICVTRSTESATRLSTAGFSAIACDVSNRETVKGGLGELAGIDTVVDCVSSGRGDSDAYRKNYLQGAGNLYEILRPREFLFTGSTSVYAQSDGSWVNEESPAEPSLETGRILRATEEFVLSRGGIVTRLAGIYGPGRWALLQKFVSGRAIIEEDGSRWLNQIHRDDAASAICFLLNNHAAPGIYNAADSTPLSQIDCYRVFADHFQKPLPPYGPIAVNRKRGVTNKRVSNAKLRSLGWEPSFSSIRDALRNDPQIVS